VPMPGKPLPPLNALLPLAPQGLLALSVQGAITLKAGEAQR
jgi:hypothetical protein